MVTFSKATQRISVGSQIGKQEVKAQSELHILHTDHVMTRREIKYLIGAAGVGTVKLEPQCSSNPAAKPRIYVRSGQQTQQDTAVRVFAMVTTQTDQRRTAGQNPDCCLVTRTRC
jgi:hypothetical protein